MTTIHGTDSGHGHVFPRLDGAVARCGGPAICPECAKDFAQVHNIAPPPSSQGAPCQDSSTPASTLSKREMLAAMALQGMLASTEYCFGKTAYAEHAVQHADALLKELAKERAQ